MKKGQWLLVISLGLEAATGLILILAPALLSHLLLGGVIEGPATIIAKVTGIALISLAVACWPRSEHRIDGAYVAMLLYNLLVGIILANASFAGSASGPLLWPVIVEHLIFAAVFAIFLIGMLTRDRMSRTAH